MIASGCLLWFAWEKVLLTMSLDAPKSYSDHLATLMGTRVIRR
jgi:hypothetical protein